MGLIDEIRISQIRAAENAVISNLEQKLGAGMSEKSSSIVGNLIQDLERKIEALETDARRYKFLRDFPSPMDIDADENEIVVCVGYVGNEDVLHGEKLDAAIDALIAND